MGGVLHTRRKFRCSPVNKGLSVPGPDDLWNSILNVCRCLFVEFDRPRNRNDRKNQDCDDDDAKNPTEDCEELFHSACIDLTMIRRKIVSPISLRSEERRVGKE